MGKESTTHAIAILTDFLKQCGGAQGAILELKYGLLSSDYDKRTALGGLKDNLLGIQNSIAQLLKELK